MNSKIILGTVQLGIPYGINNSLGKPNEEAAAEILLYAFKSGITLLDCADAYGDALRVIGNFHKKTGKQFSLINKFKLDGHKSLSDKIALNLEETGLKGLYCYMYHDYKDYQSKQAIKELQKLKEKGLIEKVGVSIYSTEQLAELVDDPIVEVVQLPINMLDLTSDKVCLLEKAKENGKELHARSIFLQGLILKDPETLTGNLKPLYKYLVRIRALSDTMGVELKRIALNFVLHKKYVSNVVLGVEHASQLKENLELVLSQFDMNEIIEISPEDKPLLNPSNWRP